MVEEASGLRSGGYIVDFWGIGYDIADKMGLVPQIRELGYQVEEVRFVDEAGHRSGGFSVDVLGKMTGGRFTSVRRSDISAVLYGALGDKISTIFGDSITKISETGSRVKVDFHNSPTQEFDLVVGADGLHSKVRELVFGPDALFEKRLGYQVAAFEVAGYPYRDELVYVSHARPGKQISRFSMRGDKTLFLFVFRDELIGSNRPVTNTEKREVLRRVFADVKWECPRILECLDETTDLYFDSVSQVRMDRWSQGRVALIGDAAACVSLLAGEGTGLAIAEAFVLAGELKLAEGDLASAFTAYQQRLMPFLRSKQSSAAKFASSFVPRSSFGIAFRDLITRLMGISFVAEYFVGRDLRDNITLPEYQFN